MIAYVEVLALNDPQSAIITTALVEPSECWFELSYYEVGQFEVYAPATAANLAALKKGRFVKLPNLPFVWYITALTYSFNADGARMVSATGYEAKWIVGQRIIIEPRALYYRLQGAMYDLFAYNLGVYSSYSRHLSFIASDFTALGEMTTDAQATRENLLSFVQNILKLHGCGTVSQINERGEIVFTAVNGQDRSATVTFSQSLDNLISATYYTSDENKKTDAQIVSSFSENNETTEYVAYFPEYGGAAGIERSEIIVNSNLSTKVKNPDGTETDLSPTDPEYIAMQRAEGAAALAGQQEVVSFEGEIDLAHSSYAFGRDFFLGDLLGIRDEYFGIGIGEPVKARVTKYTFKQDASGYGELADYGTTD